MTMAVVKVVSEWDIGLEDILFMEYRGARSATRLALEELGFEETLEELEAEGLIDYKWLEVI